MKDTTIKSERTTRQKPLKLQGDRSQVFPKKSKKKNVNRGAFFSGPIGKHFHLNDAEKSLEVTGIEIMLKNIFEEGGPEYIREGPEER